MTGYAQGKEYQLSETEGVKRRLEDDNGRLQEHATLAAHQFHKLGDESARLLQACQAERELRSKVEGSIQVKERQVSSLMEMNARLTSELSAMQSTGFATASKADAFASSSPYGPKPSMGGMGALSMHQSFEGGYSGAAAAPTGDRQKLMDEIEQLMSSFQSRR